MAFKAIAVGMIGYGASITLWVAGARDLGAARGQLIFAAAPFIGAVAAWTAFGEPVTGRQVGALLIAGCGVSFVLGSSHEHTHTHEPVEHEHEHTGHDGHHEHDDPTHVRHPHPHIHTAIQHNHPHVPDLHQMQPPPFWSGQAAAAPAPAPAPKNVPFESSPSTEAPNTLTMISAEGFAGVRARGTSAAAIGGGDRTGSPCSLCGCPQLGMLSLTTMVPAAGGRH